MSAKVQRKQGTAKKTVPLVRADLTGPAPKRFRHKQGAVFGTAQKRERIEDSPGPGNYEPRTGQTMPRKYEAIILGEEKQPSYISRKAGESPGPGQYVEEVNLIATSGKKAGSRAGAFAMSKRETEFDQVALQSARIPGPSEYTRIEPYQKGGPSFGVKREQKVVSTPGPGAYDSIHSDRVRRPQSSKVQSFSQTKRPDIWRDDKNKNDLGPAYDGVRSSFDPSAKKGPTMGHKRAEKVNKTPGPGQYSNANVISMVKSKGASVRIGQTKRPDNFTRNDGTDLPGPGNYTESTNTFGKSLKGAATMGSKYRSRVNANPGPGQYQLVDQNRIKSAKSSCKIGTTQRPDIWQKETRKDQPGPGNYMETTGTFGKTLKGAATMGSKYRPEKNLNPGPGQYNATQSMRSIASYGKIGTTKRQDIWGSDKKMKESMPGPGQHTKSYTSFGITKGALDFGVGRKDIKNENPGPGQYNNADRKLTSAKSGSVRFGSTRRPDIWEKDTKNDIPGPGLYVSETNTFGKAAKGAATMGSKYKPEVNSNPGPGQYSQEDRITKAQGNSIKLGTASRGELWAENVKNDQPGPGNYAEQPSSFGQTKGAANMGSKYREEVNLNPGPGNYNADASKLKPKTGTVRIGSAKRKDIWEEQTKSGDQPGPGLYVDETNTFGRAAKGAATMGSKYKPERNMNPGPGQYSVNDSPTKQQTSSVRISKAERQDIWAEQTRNDQPGPGNYQENTSSFANVKGVATMGSKYKPEVNANPGPGQYEQAQNDMSSHQTTNVKIGTQKVRADLFGTDSAATLPGPGAYQSPERKPKGFVIGKKQEQKIADTPGPGNYNADSGLTKHKDVTVRISQAKREDIWKEETSKADLPGPGALDVHDSAIGSGGFVFSKDERFPEAREVGPGPGTYELLDD